MKSPEYVAVVTRIYRKYLDFIAQGRPQSLSEQDRKELLSVFNRGGMTDAYLCGESGADLMSRDIPKHQGIPLGSVISCDSKRGHISARLTDTLSVGDGIEVRDGRRVCGNVVTYLNDRGTMLKSADAGRKVTVGDIKGQVRAGAEIFKITDKELMKRAEESYRKIPPSLPVDMVLTAEEGMPARLEVSSVLWRHSAAESKLSQETDIAESKSARRAENERTAEETSAAEKRSRVKVQTVSDTVLECAQKRFADKAAIQKQLSKTGGTPYYLNKLQLEISGSPMIPASLLNSLRRDALSALTKRRLEMMSDFCAPTEWEKKDAAEKMCIRDSRR